MIHHPAVDRLGPALPTGARHRTGPHRRAIVAGLCALPVVLAAAVELGGLAAVNGVLDDAQRRAASGDFAGAIADQDYVAGRSGVVFLLAHGRVDSAAHDAQALYLDWARSLAASGDVDRALAATQRVSDASLLAQARQAHARICLDDARTQAQAQHFDVALQRLGQLLAGSPPADLAATARSLLPAYGLGAGRSLLASGHAAEAVSAFDTVLSEAPGSAESREAVAALPGALLAAGQAALVDHDTATALPFLSRVVDTFPTSTQAGRARALLSAPQPVTGTLVHRGGAPLTAAQVRLGSHFRQLGGAYTTSPPYLYATTDVHGAFTFPSVPQGAGPWVLEVYGVDGWTTIVATDGQPAYTVSITPLTPVDLAFVVVPQ